MASQRRQRRHVPNADERGGRRSAHQHSLALFLLWSEHSALIVDYLSHQCVHFWFRVVTVCIDRLIHRPFFRPFIGRLDPRHKEIEMFFPCLSLIRSVSMMHELGIDV